MMDGSFNKHMAKVYLSQAIVQKRFPGWKAWLLNHAGDRRRAYLQWLRESKRDVQIELF